MAEQDLEKRFDKLLLPAIDSSQNQLKLARSFAVLNTSLLQREQLRVAKKFGDDHVRVMELKNKAAQIVESTRNTILSAAESNLVKVAPKTDKPVVSGRVLDENGTGVANVRVSLADEKGKAISGTNIVTTDKSGNYKFVLPPDLVTGDKDKTTSYRVVVASKNNKKLQEDMVLLKSAEEKIANRNLVINRAKLLRGKK